MANPLKPCLIPKYKNQLLTPPVFKPTIATDPVTDKVVSHNYTVTITQFKQQVLPKGFPKTTVWGYRGNVKCPCCDKPFCFQSSPGPTFEAVRNIPVNVQWVNDLTEPYLFAVDPTIHWANPNNIPTPIPPFPDFPPGFPLAQTPVPITIHLHGGDVRSDSDGGPEEWFTAGEAKTGPDFDTSRDHYPNQQEPTTLWYHDHALGVTRLNLYSGLAGFYIIRDPNNPIEPLLPSGPYDIPIVVQDRTFDDKGQLLFPDEGVNPELHPYWRPAFIGNTIMVNGRVWPNKNVERRQYRFRVLNASNTRTYNFKLSNNMPFIQIGSDGGFLPYPVELKELLLAPAERADILIDFSKLAPGEKIILQNDANAPYPNGNPPDPDTVGQIMRFKVCDTPIVPPNDLPSKLNDIPVFTPDVPKRTLTLYIVPGPGGPGPGPSQLLLNGQTWSAPTSELPIVGSTEEWELVNLTNGAHPIHVHLIEFLVKNRENFDSTQYREDWIKLNGEPPLQHPTLTLPVEPYLDGSPIIPPPNERGWKDTVFALPGKVTRILMRWAPQDADPKKVKPGVNLFPFDPTIGPGYVWHCHLLDHEDNEMMRRFKVINLPQMTANPQTCCQVAVEGETALIPPALVSDPIDYEKEVFADIESVCPGKVIIGGFVRRTISYTAVPDCGIKEKKTITDDIPFQCMIDRDDANSGDSFEITGATVLCEVFAQAQNFGKYCDRNEEAAYAFVAKDIVKVCIRKDC